MTPFLQLADKHPISVAVTGAAGGMGAWFITHAENVILVLQLVGGFFGCLLTIVSFVFVLPKLVRFIGRAWRLGFTRADKE